MLMITRMMVVIYRAVSSASSPRSLETACASPLPHWGHWVLNPLLTGDYYDYYKLLQLLLLQLFLVN